MKLLVIGGTGVISREIVKQASAKGFDVTIFNRGNRDCPVPEGVKVIHGDRDDAKDFAEKMSDLNVDVMIDMNCLTREQAVQDVEIFGDKVEQMIITSSIAAYVRPFKSYPIREEAEELDTTGNFIYGYNKAEIERYLQSMMGKIKAAITIIRPSLTFGEGAANFGMLRQNRNLVRRIKEGKPVVMMGEGVAPWSFTFVQDLANGFVLSCGNENTYNDWYHVTNTEIVVWEDLYHAVGKAVGKEVKMVNIPTVLLAEMLPDVCMHHYVEKRHFSLFDISKFQKAVPEYQPKVTLEEGVKALVEWWEEVDFPYDEEKDALEDRMCEAYEKFRKELLSLVK